MNSECFILAIESLVSLAIIHKVPYTEIDWKAYMQQVESWLLDGQRDYAKIRGQTGPLVYPAGFLYLFSVLWWLTDHGRNIRRAQWIYLFLQLVSVWVAIRIYRYAAGRRSLLLYMLPALIMSRRLHSILLLRLFNDPWVTLFLLGSCLSLQRRRFTLATLLYALALSIKMNALLWLPGFGMLMIQAVGFRRTALLLATTIGGVHMALAGPFLLQNPVAYFSRAFDFGRQFLYQWTVNWRFIPEYVFINQIWSAGLLLIHLTLLLLFAHCRWLRPSGGFWSFIRKSITATSQTTSYPEDMPWNTRVPMVLFTCQLIGVLCARSLHYQFYSWYCLTLPYLVFHAVFGASNRVKLDLIGLLRVFICYSILALVELSWNIYPSTKLSSFTLLLAHSVILYGLWQRQESPPKTHKT